MRHKTDIMPERHFGTRAVGCLIIILFCFGSVMKLRSWINPFDDAYFNPQKWAVASQQQRTSMTEDLLKNYLKKGLHQEDIDILLGKPGAVSSRQGRTTAEYSPNGESIYQYTLGSSGDIPFHMDGINLVIYFDEHDRMTEAYLVQT